MNDLTLINKWRDRTTEPDTTHADQTLAEHYTRDANQYPKLLIHALVTEGTTYNAHPRSWILKAHLTPKKGTKTKPKDNYINSILIPFTTMGYSIDTFTRPTRKAPPRTRHSQTITPVHTKTGSTDA
jgi:hypothetical protein